MREPPAQPESATAEAPQLSPGEPVPASPAPQERVTKLLEEARGYVAEHVSLVFLAVATYAYVMVYAYLIGFYDRFGLDPREYVVGRVETLTRVGVATLLFAGFFATVGGLIAVVMVEARKGLGSSSRARKKPSWLTPRQALNTSMRSALLPLLMVVLGIAPILSFRGGERDSRSMLRQTQDNGPSIWQLVTGAVAPPVAIRWVGGGTSPLVHNEDNVANEDYARLLGGFNGVVILVDLHNCQLLRVPASAIVVRYRVGYTPQEERVPVDPLPTCIR